MPTSREEEFVEGICCGEDDVLGLVGIFLNGQLLGSEIG
jgi:hypothetical protein